MSSESIEAVRASYIRLQKAAGEAQYWYERYVDDLKARYQARLREIETAYDGDATTGAEQGEEEAQFRPKKDRSAFRWVVAPWDGPVWADYIALREAPIPSAVRVGKMVAPQGMDWGDMPAIVPLVGNGHLFLQGKDHDVMRRLLQSIILRLMVSFPPGSIRLSLADPIGLGVNLSSFLRLPDTLRGDKVCSRPEEIERQIDMLITHVETVFQTRLLNLYPTIEDYNA